jgi:hypothetical protein
MNVVVNPTTSGGSAAISAARSRMNPRAVYIPLLEELRVLIDLITVDVVQRRGEYPVTYAVEDLIRDVAVILACDSAVALTHQVFGPPEAGVQLIDGPVSGVFTDARPQYSQCAGRCVEPLPWHGDHQDFHRMPT